MRYLIVIIIIVAHSLSAVHAQNNHSIGAGYFGETLTHPGVVLEYEFESPQSAKYAILSRSDVGYYNHPRNHRAFFIDHHIGMRHNIGSRMFMEHAIGVGVMFPMLNAPVYKVDEQGHISESSKRLNPDFRPSVTLGLGYDLNPNEERDAIWVRPTMFWQYPYNTLALPHVAMQFGFTHTFKTK